MRGGEELRPMPGNDRRHAGRGGRGEPASDSGVEQAPGPAPHASLPGNPEVIRTLNAVLKNELTAINQYFLHSRMLGDWGLSILAKAEYEESVDEMKHADRLIKRILFLDGLPNLQDLGKLLIGENVEECLGCDLKLEMAARIELKAAVSASEAAGDYVSRELFKSIMESEEEHIDFLETQLDLIKRVGKENYTQSQIKEGDE
jgi:bacterioferritin